MSANMDTNEKAHIAIAAAISQCRTVNELIALAVNLSHMAGISLGIATRDPILGPLATMACDTAFDAGIRSGHTLTKAELEIAMLAASEPTNSDINGFAAQLDAILKGKG